MKRIIYQGPPRTPRHCPEIQRAIRRYRREQPKLEAHQASRRPCANCGREVKYANGATRCPNCGVRVVREDA